MDDGVFSEYWIGEDVEESGCFLIYYNTWIRMWASLFLDRQQKNGCPICMASDFVMFEGNVG